MVSKKDLILGKEALAVIGLGYVGLPLAIAFSEKMNVIGFDINEKKIGRLKNGIDETGEVGSERLKASKVFFTNNEKELKKAKFFIVAVPTPINADKTPNLMPMIGASEIVGKNMENGSIVVYESTVYPGVTEDVCLPILIEKSGLEFGVDFKIGYSPERINPGDKEHTVDKIVKVVSGCDEETLETVAAVYESIITAGVHKASSIKVAEAAKVIENAQRDINIAFMNELSIIFNKIGIDTKEVLDAAATKWNFMKFFPGLVGGHCIGVDPYYLTYRAEQLGYHSLVVLSGRRINDDMPVYIADNVVKRLIAVNKHIQKARIGILGITFKENCPDIRNSKVADVIRELKDFGVNIIVSDPEAEAEEVMHEYGVELQPMSKMVGLDAVVVAVPHSSFKAMKIEDFKGMFGPGTPVMIDVKAIFDKNAFIKSGFEYWRL